MLEMSNSLLWQPTVSPDPMPRRQSSCDPLRNPHRSNRQMRITILVEKTSRFTVAGELGIDVAGRTTALDGDHREAGIHAGAARKGSVDSLADHTEQRDALARQISHRIDVRKPSDERFVGDIRMRASR